MGIARAAARLFLPEAIAIGLSANATLNALKLKGLGYRRIEFLKDFREFKGLKASVDKFKNIRKDMYPDKGSFQKGYVPQGRKYSFMVKLSGFDAEGGVVKDTYVTIIGDANMRIADIEETARQEFGQLVSGGYLNATEAIVTSGVINEDQL